MQIEQRYSFHWLSQQGHRPTNQDYGAMVRSNGSSFAVITDGVSKHVDAGNLARDFCCFFAERADKFPLTQASSPDQCIRGWLATARVELGRKYPYVSAAYAIAWQNGTNLHTWHEGDCRVGILSENRQLSWTTNDHSIATWQNVSMHEDLVNDVRRHKLYRCFKSTKLAQPDLTITAINPGESIVLATDGFWAGIPQAMHVQAAELESLPDEITNILTDNASRLTIQLDSPKFFRSSATNFQSKPN